MGFETTLALFDPNNTPFAEEYQTMLPSKGSDTNSSTVPNSVTQSLKSWVNRFTKKDDPVAEARGHFLNTLIDIHGIFYEFGKENSDFNIACIDLILEYFHAKQHEANTDGVPISDMEHTRLAKLRFQTSTKNLTLQTPHEEHLKRKYKETHQEYFKKIIDSLWEYKRQLLLAARPLANNTTSSIFLNKLKAIEKLKKNNFVVDLPRIREAFPGTADSLLAFEHELQYDINISLDERISLGRELMEYKMSLWYDYRRSLQDEGKFSLNSDKNSIRGYNLSLAYLLKPHLDALVTQVKSRYKNIHIKFPESSAPFFLSDKTQALGHRLFARDIADKAKTLHILRDMEKWSDTLFSTCSEGKFHPSFQVKVKESIRAFTNILKTDIELNPALCKSDIIAKYTRHIQAEVEFTLGINSYYNPEDLTTVRKAILKHKDYALISNHSHKMSDNAVKTAMLVGLGVILFTTAAFLTLALTPATAKFMTSVAAHFAAHAQGYLALATATIAAPAVIAAASTAAVVRFKAPPSPMPHGDIIAESKYAYNNQFVS